MESPNKENSQGNQNSEKAKKDFSKKLDEKTKAGKKQKDILK